VGVLLAALGIFFFFIAHKETKGPSDERLVVGITRFREIVTKKDAEEGKVIASEIVPELKKKRDQGAPLEVKGLLNSEVQGGVAILCQKRV
jgi:hypothetical protein